VTVGIGGYDSGDLASLLSEAEDRKTAAYLSGGMEASPTYEVIRTIDPSDGVNYSGGSSYTPGMPLLGSNAGLAGYGGAVREASFGSMTYEEAMNYTPAPLTQRIDALRAGAGRQFAGLEASQSLNPLWYLLAAGALFWIFSGIGERSYRY
jgi:hypothetical protein